MKKLVETFIKPHQSLCINPQSGNNRSTGHSSKRGFFIKNPHFTKPVSNSVSKHRIRNPFHIGNSISRENHIEIFTFRTLKKKIKKLNFYLLDDNISTLVTLHHDFVHKDKELGFVQFFHQAESFQECLSRHQFRSCFV